MAITVQTVQKVLVDVDPFHLWAVNHPAPVPGTTLTPEAATLPLLWREALREIGSNIDKVTCRACNTQVGCLHDDKPNKQNTYWVWVPTVLVQAGNSGIIRLCESCGAGPDLTVCPNTEGDPRAALEASVTHTLALLAQGAVLLWPDASVVPVLHGTCGHCQVRISRSPSTSWVHDQILSPTETVHLADPAPREEGK